MCFSAAASSENDHGSMNLRFEHCAGAFDDAVPATPPAAHHHTSGNAASRPEVTDQKSFAGGISPFREGDT